MQTTVKQYQDDYQHPAEWELNASKSYFAAPGAFDIAPESLAFHSLDMGYVVEPGDFEIVMGANDKKLPTNSPNENTQSHMRRRTPPYRGQECHKTTRLNPIPAHEKPNRAVPVCKGMRQFLRTSMLRTLPSQPSR